MSLNALKTFRFAIIASSSLLLATGAEAATYTFDLSESFFGAPPTSPAKPWVRATFTDVGIDQVQLEITAPNLAGPANAPETLKELYFNLVQDTSVGSLSFSKVAAQSSGVFIDPTIAKSTDQYKADGDGNFDIQFMFTTSMVDDRFTQGDRLTYLISGLSGLDAGDFVTLSEKKNPSQSGPFLAAARINWPDGWIATSITPAPVPEPSTIASLALGIAALGLVMRRRTLKD